MQSLIYFLVVAALFVFMMRFGCGAHVMGHGHRHGGSRDPDQRGASSPVSNTDPVCGMTVDNASAKPSLYQGRAYYFCSATCRDKFEASPETYMKGSERSPQVKEVDHGTHH